MKELMTLNKRIEYSHRIEYNGEEYTREEVMMPESFAWESEPDKLIDLHTISWNKKDSEQTKEYYSCDHGWSGEDGYMHKGNPVPDIEIEFKKTIGKNLIYFEEVINRNK